MLASSLFRRCARSGAIFRVCFSSNKIPQKSIIPFRSLRSTVRVNLPSRLSYSRLYSTETAKQSKESIKEDDGEFSGSKASQKNLTTKERLKIITTQYGAFGMAFHITISLASLGLFYFLVYSGVDFTAAMEYVGMESSKIAAGASTFVVAYAVHKVFAPVRIGITFVSVPILVKHFRKIGFFKNK